MGTLARMVERRGSRQVPIGRRLQRGVRQRHHWIGLSERWRVKARRERRAGTVRIDGAWRSVVSAAVLAERRAAL